MSSPKNMNTPKTWGNLSMKEKADIMKVAVQNGITNLQDIKDVYEELMGNYSAGAMVDTLYENNPTEEYVGEFGNDYANGGKIHIKPSHRGRLTELKKRTGKSEAELYNDGNPAHKKMVVFARNARKWKHGFGGNLYGEGGPEDNTSKQAPWYSELDEAVLGKVMQQFRNIAHPQNAEDVSGGTDVRAKVGGTAQRTYLLPRFEQEDIFLRDGYIKGKEGDYGLVKQAVNNRNLPVWQTKPDAVSRETLVPIGNAYGMDSTGYIPSDKALVHAGSYPSAFYVDGSTGKLYTKGWDLNDYGGTGKGASNEYNIFGKAAANILDFIGNPVVVTTGFQEVTNPFRNPSKLDSNRGATIQDLFGHTTYDGYPIESHLGKLLDNTMAKRGLHRENIDGKWLYALPEVVVTAPKKKSLGGPLVDAANAHIYDGTTEPTQQMNRKTVYKSKLGRVFRTKEEAVADNKRYYAMREQAKDRNVLAAPSEEMQKAERGIKGARQHAAFAEEHPFLENTGMALGAAPLAVAAIPAVSTAVEAAPAVASTLAPGSAFWTNPVTQQIMSGAIGGTVVDAATQAVTKKKWGEGISDVVEYATGWNPQNNMFTNALVDMTNPGYLTPYGWIEKGLTEASGMFGRNAVKTVSSKIPTITAENAASMTDAQWDAAFNKAFNAGDKEEQRRLVDLHFMAKAPDTKITNLDGTPAHIYHGTNSDWVKYDPKKFGSATDDGYYGVGLYGTEDKRLARGYGDNVLDLYINAKHPFTAGTQDINNIPYTVEEATNRGKVVYHFNRPGRNYNYPNLEKNYKDLVEELDASDAVVYGTPNQRFNEVVIPKGTQAKLADVITYDNKGDVIPLSKRHNFKINDIRYGLLAPIMSLPALSYFNNIKQ